MPLGFFAYQLPQQNRMTYALTIFTSISKLAENGGGCSSVG